MTLRPFRTGWGGAPGWAMCAEGGREMGCLAPGTPRCADAINSSSSLSPRPCHGLFSKARAELTPIDLFRRHSAGRLAPPPPSHRAAGVSMEAVSIIGRFGLSIHLDIDIHTTNTKTQTGPHRRPDHDRRADRRAGAPPQGRGGRRVNWTLPHTL